MVTYFSSNIAEQLRKARGRRVEAADNPVKV
jgi:hypothetical protein